ncbi:MAG: LysR family transcriptional regulator, glycine cleavage system transcriptional activator [Rhodospirillaceae bacterium]|nr:LysR family transcriptional regulator, glycine cleavage system transcriptional activator [Rhodospirillaceae bacterium]
MGKVVNQPRIPSLAALRAFEAVARNLSFTRAADELRITQGAVSYQIKQLVSELGVPLFRWDGRVLVLTEEARKLLPVVQRSFVDIGEVLATISRRRGDFPLTIALSTYFAAHWLSKRLGRFWQHQPGIRLRLQHPEFPVEFGTGKADLSIRWLKADWNDPTLRVELLFLSEISPVCSPSLQTGRPPLDRPNDLQKHKLLRDETVMEAWAAWFKVAGIDYRIPMHELSINDPNVYMQAAVDGQGVALGDTLLADEIALHRLTKPFDVYLSGYGYFIVYPPDALRRPNVKAFRDWLLTEAHAKAGEFQRSGRRGGVQSHRRLVRH